MADARPVEFFDAGTDIGRAYAAVAWADSPVGLPADWPESLRTTFSLMVSSRFAMWMAWGPDLTFFCNDAYRRDTLGRKYPWALGRPASQVWAEIWPDVGPLVTAVMAGDGATWDEGLRLFLERSGFVEETYHTFSYSPLFGDDGVIAGLLCVVSEDTGRVLSQRRIAALSDLASGLSSTGSAAEVFVTAQARLANDPLDLPFVAGYLLEVGTEGGDVARLAFTSGVPDAHPVAPRSFRPGDLSTPWAEHWPADGTPRVVEDLPGMFTDLPTGGWSEPPARAVVAPLRTSGEHARVAGALVVGMNPHRAVDAEVVDFVSLVADQLAGAIARGQAFDAERERVEQMAELDRAKTTFFTNISHELRTPLTLLLGPAEDALADVTAPLAPTQRRRVEVVHRNAERLLKLVNTLLDFSRLESGRTQASFEPVALDRLTAELAGMFESAFVRAGLTLTIECEPPDAPVFVDREMWSKIVLNLLSNALKATYTGGVTVQLRQVADGVELSVGDTGVGIPAEEQARLFERFHRVAGARLRSHEGSGIGLALVAELASLHGARVAVDSAEGAGSTFTVTLPTGSAHLPPEQVTPTAQAPARTSDGLGAGYLAEAARWLPRTAADAGVADADGGHDRSPATGGRHRVLVVDDNADMRDYVTDVLAGEFAVETAADGRAGLARAVADPPDLVLTDVMMPLLDGFGLLRALRDEPTTAHVPVVMLSARSGDEAAVEGLEAGADDYLVKPFSQRELLARVRANLELDRVRRTADELARSREMLTYAEELAQVGSFDYDVPAGTLRGTPQFFALTGFDPEVAREAVDRRILVSVRADDRDRVRDAVLAALAGGPDIDLEFAVGADDDDERLLWLRAVVDRDPDGAALRLRGSVQDITARIAAQAAAEALVAAREVAAREHQIAHELQQSLLPSRTLSADHLDLAAFYRAGVEGTQVGGDWYDVIDLEAGRTAFVLGDVMGRGIQAATVMGQLRATVRAYARIELAPDVLMQLLDDAVQEIRPDMIVTCVYAVYDPTDQSFTYANAGHLPPLLTCPGEPVRRLARGGPPLGTGRGWVEPETITLPTGSLLALYTDGLVERRGQDVDDGIDALAALLATAPDDIATVPSYLTDALLREGLDDDVALLVARVSDRAGSDRVMVTSVPPDLAEVATARDLAAGCVADWGGGERLVEDVRLIVSELVTNAVLHGEPPVQLRVRKGGRRLQVEVYDSAVSSPRLRRAAPQDNHGRGLLIVSLLSDRWGTRPTPEGKSVWCQLQLG